MPENNHEDPLETFVDHAMYLHSIHSKPLSEVRDNYSRLIAAVYMRTRLMILDEIAKDRKIENEKESRLPHRL